MENKRNLLVREVDGAQLSPYWANRRLEVPEIKWVPGADPGIKEGEFFSKSARAERGEKFWVTTPTLAKPRPF